MAAVVVETVTSSRIMVQEDLATMIELLTMEQLTVTVQDLHLEMTMELRAIYRLLKEMMTEPQMEKVMTMEVSDTMLIRDIDHLGLLVF